MCTYVCCRHLAFTGQLEKCQVSVTLVLFRSAPDICLDSAKPYAGHFILSLRFLTSAVFKSFIRYFLYYPDELTLRSSFYETIAFPLLLPLSLCQDLDPRLSQINSHSRLCGYLLQPSSTSPNDPLSGHSLRFQLPFPPALLPHACAPPNPLPPHLAKAPSGSAKLM